MTEPAKVVLHGAVTVPLAYGMVVVAAPGSTDSPEGWDPAADPIHAGTDSLYVSTRQAASGPVAITCVEGPCATPGLSLLFRGVITLPKSTLEIYDPNGAVRLELPVERQENQIEIHGDDPAESAQLLVVLTALPLWSSLERVEASE